MKASEQHLSEVCRRHNEAVVARHVHELFKRLPMLSGFWLRFDLKVTELSVFTWPGYTAGGEPHVQPSPHAKHAVSRQLLVDGSGKGVVQ